MGLDLEMYDARVEVTPASHSLYDSDLKTLSGVDGVNQMEDGLEWGARLVDGCGRRD